MAEDLAAYTQRVRADHLLNANGWCSCGKPVCPQARLLAHIDDLILAYQLKVAEFARETLRNSKLAASLAKVRELHRPDELGDCVTCSHEIGPGNPRPGGRWDCAHSDRIVEWPCPTIQALGEQP
jgi:hypothetical protein